jgi:hypothetical protein
MDWAALLASDQHDSEASFVSHHASVSFGGICQRNGFDHRADLLPGQESVSSASIGVPVIVPAIERVPKRSGTGFTSIGVPRASWRDFLFLIRGQWLRL